MKIRVFSSEAEFDRACAEAIVNQIKTKPDSVIGLSTGRTTVNMHRIVCELHDREGFDVSGITLLNVDEFAGVPADYPGTCGNRLLEAIVRPLGLSDGQFIMFPTESDDYKRDCAAFTAEIERRGGLDLQMLGLGENGHIGFNQPGTPFGYSAWVCPLLPEVEEKVRRETGIGDAVRPGGATLGPADIMKVRRVILVAKGDNKTDIVQRIIEGPVSEEFPATVLQGHPGCEYWLDAKAAAKLRISK